ncbi:non-ribosomal peptide synthetase [Nitrospirillum iridis]|uniref:Amino acid adenylation domain-containing protein n=1 Tax=Nitrospirillum iridis TaxID=765888 RepID=A0A7X0B2H4_9PROT|nr:non-ribosomal peptide synthetase [Nitrospirillum iridis]MBB6254528.1 amino acid adenylation domain-containing protein [Nitrospirillum iridis]
MNGPFHSTKLLIDRFDEQALRRPEAIAVVDQGVTLTYAQLLARARGLAAQLCARGIGPGSRVGVLVGRSVDLVVTIVAVGYTGAAYVPLDVDCPPDRARFVLTDAKVSLIVTDQPLGEQLGMAALPPAGSAEGGGGSDLTSRSAPNSNDPAYIIYTSGSTGQPKGVLVSHGNAARLFDATKSYYDFGPEDVWLLFHSIAFDFSVWELWGALAHGGRLVVVPYIVSRSGRELIALVASEGVTILNLTPSGFRQLVADIVLDELVLPDLRWLIFAGEPLAPVMLTKWCDRFGDKHPQIANMYGITETTVHSAFRRIRAPDLLVPRSPIGRPIDDTTITLRDAEGRLVGPGEIGEIWVHGPGVALGYLDRPELTASRFFTEGPGALFDTYRSGDLAAWNAEGELEYHGRMDDQIKLRGYRIELGEIEHRIRLAWPGCEAAVIVSGEGSEAQLAAFMTVADGKMIASTEIRQALAPHLPSYMMPATIMAVSELPLTVNGKTDRAALRRRLLRASSDSDSSTAVGAPSTLLAIWRDVLNVPDLGEADNIFDHGANSFLVVQASHRIKREFGAKLTLREIFTSPSVAEMLSVLAQKAPSIVTQLVSG